MDIDITSYEKYIRHLAKNYRNFSDIEDFIQEGYVGVLIAKKNFDPNNGALFLTYADKYIRQKLQDFWYKNFNILKIGDTKENRKIISLIYKNKIINDDFSVNINKINDICQQNNIKYEKVIDILQYIQSTTELIKTDKNGNEYYVTDLVDDYNQNDPLNFIQGIDKSEIHVKLVHMLKEVLDEREFDIIFSRYFLDKPDTYKQLGEKYGCSGQRIEQIEKRLLKKIKNHLTKFEDYI